MMQSTMQDFPLTVGMIFRHGRTVHRASEVVTFPWGPFIYAELLLYNMRHVQHHAAQLNLLLRQTEHKGSRWVKRGGGPELGG